MRKITDKAEIFEKLPVKTAVWKQILPAIASQMIVLIYNLADTYFVGLLNDPRETAAVTVVTASFIMLTAISNLFGVGGGSMMARFLGKKEEKEARSVSRIAVWGGVAAACLFSIVFALLAKPILYLCGAGPEIYPLALGYARWTVIIGGPATIMNALLANLVRAEGNAGIASFGISLGCVVNIILDPLFILPQFMGAGAVGAGAATAISNMLSMAFFMLYVVRKNNSSIIGLRFPAIADVRKHMMSILSIGFPSAVQYALTVVGVSAQMYFVSAYRTEAVAALGITKKLDLVPLFFSIGVANGLLPLLAYNDAAGNHRRRQAAFFFGCKVSCLFAVFCLICYELFAPYLVGLFIDDALTRSYGAAFLRIMVTAMPLMAVGYPMIVQFQAMGRVKESLICSVLRKGVIDIPLLFILDALWPLYGCMLVQPAVDAISLSVAIWFYGRILRQQRKQKVASVVQI